MTGRSEPGSWGPSGAAGSSGAGLLLAPVLKGSVGGFFPGSRGGPPIPKSGSGPWTVLREGIVEFELLSLHVWGEEPG